MGYVYRGGREKLAAELQEYSEALKKANRNREKFLPPRDSHGEPIGRTVSAKLRAIASAEAAAIARLKERRGKKKAKWERYANDPACWGGAFGLWLAVQEAKEWERARHR
ncbi:hypothetical protein [Sinomonas sp. R1AF57]|uniref:hypothetical protein n=1 Tax=Sinomonas sp. R1AF57 TaxID=2020377 RepID=UPI000B60BF7C|nr:hypothetical protein [Sinomonas sp. R1AF57]ASN53402.1 hypothetical protein CGQ25_15935 [Sinomonas sp. R1AF57]